LALLLICERGAIGYSVRILSGLLLEVRMSGACLKIMSLVVAAAALANPPVGAASKAQLAPIVIKLVPYADEHWAFKAKIRGREELFVMDTGGGLTAVSP
jgi:hypothetical protein